MASSFWQQRMRDSSLHEHKSANEVVGLPGRLFPEPAGHPKQGLEQLKDVECEMCSSCYMRREDLEVLIRDSAYSLSI